LTVYLIPSESVGSQATNSLERRNLRRLSATETSSIQELTSVTTDDSGQAAATLVIPEGVPTGDYVLQFVGATTENALRTINLGIRVLESTEEPSISISGTRGEIGNRRGIIVTGTTTGLEGNTVFPRFKVRGQSQYSDGIARRLIPADGTFDWQRRGGKKIYVYFQVVNDVIRSNRLIFR
jgi:hypothetical protein